MKATDGTILRYPLDPAHPDAVTIVNWLQSFAIEFGMNPEVRAFTEVVLPANLRDDDTEQITRALLEFVQERVVFVGDPQWTEYVKSPLVMISEIMANGRVTGDCDDHVLLLASMLRSVGIDARIVGVKQGPSSVRFDHVIVEVPGPTGPVDVDPCAKHVGTPYYPQKLIPQL